MFEIYYFYYDIHINDKSKNLFESHVKHYAPVKRINMHDIYHIEGNIYICTKAYAPEHIEVTLTEVKKHD